MTLMPARIEEIEAACLRNRNLCGSDNAVAPLLKTPEMLALCAAAKKGLALDGLGEDAVERIGRVMRLHRVNRVKIWTGHYDRMKAELKPLEKVELGIAAAVLAELRKIVEGK